MSFMVLVQNYGSWPSYSFETMESPMGRNEAGQDHSLALRKAIDRRSSEDLSEARLLFNIQSFFSSRTTVFSTEQRKHVTSQGDHLKETKSSLSINPMPAAEPQHIRSKNASQSPRSHENYQLNAQSKETSFRNLKDHNHGK